MRTRKGPEMIDHERGCHLLNPRDATSTGLGTCLVQGLRVGVAQWFPAKGWGKEQAYLSVLNQCRREATARQVGRCV